MKKRQSPLVKKVMERLFNCPYAYICIRDGVFKASDICPTWEIFREPCEGVENDVKENGA